MLLRLSIAIIVPIITSIQLLPQLYKTYKTKSVGDISFYTILFILINNILWTIHGYFIVDYSLIMSGIFSIIINSMLFVLYIIYNKNKNNYNILN